MKINLRLPFTTLCVSALLLITSLTRAQVPLSFSRSGYSNFNQNIKTVLPTGDVDTSTWLYYSIIIQNTSISFVQNAKIVDTLSENLDLTSFQYLSTSDTAPVTASFNGNVLAFNLTNTNLPSQYEDSLLSQAYVQYKIKPKAGLAAGTQILNSATILLGSNEPIITDTTISTISFTAGITTLYLNETPRLNVFPNPVSQKLSVSASGFTPKWLTVYSINGQIIGEQEYKPQLDVSALSNGIYFIEVKNENAIARSRFVKISQ